MMESSANVVCLLASLRRECDGRGGVARRARAGRSGDQRFECEVMCISSISDEPNLSFIISAAGRASAAGGRGRGGSRRRADAPVSVKRDEQEAGGEREAGDERRRDEREARGGGSDERGGDEACCCLLLKNYFVE